MAVLCRIPCAAPASGIQERRPLCQQRRLEQVCNGHQGPCKRTTDQLASSLELHLLLFRYSIIKATYLSPIASFPVLPTQLLYRSCGEKAGVERLFLHGCETKAGVGRTGKEAISALPVL